MSAPPGWSRPCWARAPDRGDGRGGGRKELGAGAETCRRAENARLCEFDNPPWDGGGAVAAAAAAVLGVGGAFAAHAQT
eukprot:360685-Chlamydomonas_euryale.AAC.7